MLLMFLAILFGFIWYVMNKELKSEFNRYLKYGSLFLIVLLVAIDVFMFIETERMIKVSNTPIQYIMTNEACPNGMAIVAGTNISGNLNSLCKQDNDTLNVRYTGGGGGVNLDLRFNISATNPQSVNFMYKSNDSDNDTLMQYNDGSGWVTFYSLATTITNNTYVSISIPVLYSVNSSLYTQIRIYDVAPPASTGMLSIDKLTITDGKVTSIYSSKDIDTGTIVSYHYSEYAVMPLLANVIPALILAIILFMFIQYMMSMYVNQMSGKNQKLMEEDFEKKHRTQ